MARLHGIFVGLDKDVVPCVRNGRGIERDGALDEGARRSTSFFEADACSYGHGGFHAVDRNFAVALRGVRVPEAEARTVGEDGKVQGAAGDKMAYVNVAAVGSRWARAMFAGFGGLHPDDSAEGRERDGKAGHGPGNARFELPGMNEVFFKIPGE